MPVALDHVVKKCLAKDPDERWQTAHDLKDELRWIVEGGSSSETSTGELQTVTPRERLGWILAMFAVALVAGLIVWRVTGMRSPQPVMRLGIPFKAAEPILMASPMVISLDGARLVYAAGTAVSLSRLYTRPIERFEATPIRGTERGALPFFSPDGEWVGFFADGKLKKVPVGGGVPKTICDVPDYAGAGADWSPDGHIIFGTSITGLWRVSATGGTPQIATTPDKNKGEISHRWPQILPGGKAVLFTVQGPDPMEFRIAVESLATRERRNLTEATYARYATIGQLVCAREGSLLAYPFAVGRLEITGPEVPILENVRFNRNGAAQFAISGNGSLVYVPSEGQSPRTLVSVDRQGTARPLPAPARVYEKPRLSSDGRRLAVEILDGTHSDIWTYSLGSDVFTRLTYDGSNCCPLWTLDGKHLVFTSHRAGPFNLFIQAADGGGQAERFAPSANGQWAGSWSPDGRVLAFMEFNADTLGDISLLPFQGERRARPFLRVPFTQWGAKISPDGRWLAYVSDETGRFEVYVTCFPSGRGKWQISTEGGREVVWATNGRELYYRDGDKMMTVGIDDATSFSATKPRQLFSGYLQGAPGLPEYDVAPDGHGFVMIKASDRESAPAQMNVIVNWFEEMKNKRDTGLKR